MFPLCCYKIFNITYSLYHRITVNVNVQKAEPSQPRTLRAQVETAPPKNQFVEL